MSVRFDLSAPKVCGAIFYTNGNDFTCILSVWLRFLLYTIILCKTVILPHVVCKGAMYQYVLAVCTLFPFFSVLQGNSEGSDSWEISF